jgi:hypothetical protein
MLLDSLYCLTQVNQRRQMMAINENNLFARDGFPFLDLFIKRLTNDSEPVP